MLDDSHSFSFSYIFFAMLKFKAFSALGLLSVITPFLLITSKTVSSSSDESLTSDFAEFILSGVCDDIYLADTFGAKVPLLAAALVRNPPEFKDKDR